MRKRKRKPPTCEELHELFIYNIRHRILRWRIKPCKNIRAGDPAGTIEGTGYFRVGINGRRYFAHQIIWCMMTGKWPTQEIDHRDGNGLNNKWTNLREATSSQNGMNTKTPSNNTSGYKGVTLHLGKYWRAQIWLNKKRIHLGFFPNPEAAHAAYCEAALELFGDFARFE